MENTPRLPDNLDVRKFYKEQGGTIEQLVNGFGTSLPDSCKRSVEKWNLNSLENVINTFDLFQKSKNKKLSDCIKECGMTDFSEDLKFCYNLILLQNFCKEEELHSGKKMIDNDNLDFLDNGGINVLVSQGTNDLSNRQKIKEVRDAIQHHRYTCLPEGIYIDNPIGPKHNKEFKAIVKRSFIESMIHYLYLNVQRTYLDEVDFGNVNFDTGFDDNKDKIKMHKRIAKNKSGYTQIMALASRSIMPNYFEQSNFEQIEQRLTPREIEHLSTFFNSHSFGPEELQSCLSYKDGGSFRFLRNFLNLLISGRDGTYEDLMNSNVIRGSLAPRALETEPHSEDYMEFRCSWRPNIGELPGAEELIHVFTDLIKKTFSENTELINKNSHDRKELVFNIVNKEISDYLTEYMCSDMYYKNRKREIEEYKIKQKSDIDALNSGIIKTTDINEASKWGIVGAEKMEDGTNIFYFEKDTDYEKWKQRGDEKHNKIMAAWKRIDSMNVSEYKDEIHFWRELSDKEKQSYIKTMKEKLMKFFDWIYSCINFNEVYLKLHLEGVPNDLKTTYISNYYINDPSLIPLGNVQNIPEREHIRNASGHIKYTSLPGTNEVLLKDPSKRDDTSDWERIYNLQTLYERCLKKTNKRFSA